MSGQEILWFETEEDLRQAAYYGDNKEEVTRAAIEDRVRIGKKPEDGEEVVIEEPVEQQPIDQTVAEEPIAGPEVAEPEEPVVEEKVDEEDKSFYFENKLKEIQTENERKYAEAQAEFARKEQELKEKIEAMQSQPAPEPVQHEPQKTAVELAEEDIDLATEFEKNNRKMIEALKNEKGLSSTEYAERLKKIEEGQQKFFEQQEILQKEKKEAENRRLLYEELDGFAKNVEVDDYKLPEGKGFEETYNMHKEFKAEIAKALGITDPGEIEKNYRRIIRDDSGWAKAQRKKIEDANVSIPERAEQFLNLFELNERRNGKKFDAYEGKMKDIRDKFGYISYLDLESAFRLENYDRLLTKAGVDQAKLLQQRLEEQDSAAVVLDEQEVSNAAGEIEVPEDEAMQLMRMDPIALMQNENLFNKYVAVYKQYGMELPAFIKEALAK